DFKSDPRLFSTTNAPLTPRKHCCFVVENSVLSCGRRKKCRTFVELFRASIVRQRSSGRRVVDATVHSSAGLLHDRLGCFASLLRALSRSNFRASGSHVSNGGSAGKD